MATCALALSGELLQHAPEQLNGLLARETGKSCLAHLQLAAQLAAVTGKPGCRAAS
ncbi:hypothetical protein HNP73_000371 [Amaricoccus macauensis]|uniref:Uncharacterized protein n=1 Tax=Amaricoccus macauensis TaxID=57001 RepID=A0A840SI58_9RHOB|nr:hypothetical protein [Amaricoccus macauensis]